MPIQLQHFREPIMPIQLSDKPLEISFKSGSKLSIFEQLQSSVAIRNLDVDGVREMCHKIGIPVAGQGNDTMLMIAHRCRMKLHESSPKEKQDSEDWLRFRNLL